MKRLLAIITILMSVFAGTAAAQSGETIDRIIATVNRQPLLLSDWDASLRIEAFLQGRSVASFSNEERKAALNRLIDRELLLQQMQADYSPSPEEVAQKMGAVRTQMKATDDATWRELLKNYSLAPAEVESFIRSQLQVMRFVDLRLRPTVRVDEDTIEAYYRESLVPEVKKTGAEPAPLQQVRPTIREILVQQKMDGVLETWLANLRSQSEVHIASDPDTMSGRLLPGGGVEPKTRIPDHK
jgi:SurA N-terminal domain